LLLRLRVREVLAVVAKDWKKKNYNTSVKVSEATIQGLREGKTFEGNVAKFKSGATAEQREAMNRFYGKNRVGAALGDGVAKDFKSYPSNSYNVPNKTTNNPGPGYKGAGSTNYKAPKAKGPTMGSVGKNVGTFVQNELLGVDDFKRSVKYAKQGNVKGAVKSYATGSAELGLTAASVVGSFFTGGATGAALLGAKGAAVAGKVAVQQGAKSAAKQGAKTAAKSTAKGATSTAKKVVKTAAGGSVKTGAGKTVKGVVKAPKAGYKAVKGAGNVFVAVTPAAKTAAAATKTSKAATAAYKAKKAEAGGKAAKGMGASYDAMKTSGKAASQARSTLKKKVAKGKLVRKGARRGQMVHYGAATMTRDEKK